MGTEKCARGWDLANFLPLLAALLAQYWAAAHPTAVEAYWSSAYPLIDLCLSTLALLLPVSPTEVCLLLLILGICWLLARGFRSRHLGPLRLVWRGVCRSALLCGLLALWFLAGWGLNYRRPPITQRWHLAVEQVDETRVRKLAAEAVLLANTGPITEPSEPWDLAQDASRLASLVRSVCHQMDGPPPLLSVAVRIPVAWRLLEWLGIDGLTSPFFHEVLLNPQQGSRVRNAVLAHELAHACGYAREDAASLVGLLACKRSPNPADRYAYALFVMMHLWKVPLADGRKALEHLAPGPRRDLEAEWARLKARRSPLTRAQSALNDFYLRSAGDPHGTDSYSRVIILLAAHRHCPSLRRDR